MKRLFITLALLLYAGHAFADQCESSPKSSVALTQSSSTKLVSGVSGHVIYVCHYDFTAATGTAATYQFSYGSGSACGTGTTALTGAYAGGATTVINAGDGQAVITQALAGKDLCIIMGGSGNSAQGVLTYVIP